MREDVGQTLPVPRCDCLPTAKVSKKPRAVMVRMEVLESDGNQLWPNNKENR
jgi:hypothetical protein